MNTETEYRDRRSILGERFGNLKVISYDHTDYKSHISYWLCKCDCGKEKVVRRDGLIDGKVSSCGCLTSKFRVKNETESFRRQAIRAAKDLYYGKDVEKNLRNATTINEMNRIMQKARLEKFK